MLLIIALIFLSEWPLQAIRIVPAFNVENLFLPYGVILFALAGWTAIEPIYDSYRGHSTGRGFLKRGFQFGLGTFGAALAYLFFVVAILSGAAEVTSDTVSGLSNWALWKVQVLGFLGILALLTSFWPIGLEIKNLITKDLRWPRGLARGVILFLPIALIFLGLKSFLGVVSLVGGVFLALQYFFLVVVGAKVIQARGLKKWGLYLISLVFLVGAVYEVYYFVLR